jgi:hypothetical protein
MLIMQAGEKERSDGAHAATVKANAADPAESAERVKHIYKVVGFVPAEGDELALGVALCPGIEAADADASRDEKWQELAGFDLVRAHPVDVDDAWEPFGLGRAEN